jgi:hypothetical protein
VLPWQRESIRADTTFLKNDAVLMETVKRINKRCERLRILDVMASNVTELKKCPEGLHHAIGHMSLNCREQDLDIIHI